MENDASAFFFFFGGDTGDGQHTSTVSWSTFDMFTEFQIVSHSELREKKSFHVADTATTSCSHNV